MRGGLRGMRGRGNILRPPFFRKHFIPHIPFDPILAEFHFTRVTPPVDDSEFTAALLKCNQDLTPSNEEQTTIIHLVSIIQCVMEAITVSPGSFEACQIEEVRQVGSFKKGTMLAGHNIADIVVILKTLPTPEAVQRLAEKVLEEVRAADNALRVVLEINEGGFNINSTNNTSACRLLIATIPPNLRKLEPELHLNPKILQGHLAAIRHSRWFEENGNNSTVKVLIRILRDLRIRYEGLSPLNPWIIDLLAYHSVMRHPLNAEPLGINQAFRRAIQILAAGLFIPGSAGIADPCEGGSIRVHTAMTIEEQDMVCMTAQNLLRVLLHGNYKAVLGIEPPEVPVKEMCVVNEVVISALVPVYQKPTEGEENETEDSSAMETQE